MAEPTALDLRADVVALTAALVDIPSESRHEARLADLVQDALTAEDHLEVTRVRNNVVARTVLGRDSRVLIGGHLDTVPSAGNLPHHFDGAELFGLGSCDMKGGVAVMLHAAAALTRPDRDVTYVFYECEEIEETANGLRHLAETSPELLAADFAVLMEPSNAQIEAGCQGTLRAVVTTHGRRSHSARAWMGHNAVHEAAEILNRLAAYEPAEVEIDGLTYREGLNAVGIQGGIAGNVIPDRCEVTVNYRFAPDQDIPAAKRHVEEIFEGFPVVFVDEAPGALPGLTVPAAREFISVIGRPPAPKFGWTDVARFAALGIPAVNYGPGDPAFAHAPDEHVPVEQIRACAGTVTSWLS